MTNQVDTSQETIEREWARIAAEHQAMSVESQPEPLEPVTGGKPEGLDFEGIDGVKVEQGQAGTNVVPQGEQETTGATLEEKIAMAEMVINGGLVFVFDALGGLDIPADKYRRMSHSWAVVIAKRFEGGIFEFMAKYKDELAAVGATFVFIGAVRESARAKREAREAEERSAAVGRQDAKATQKGETIDHD